MMSSLWNSLFYQPILQGLIFFYKALGNNFGWAIITITILIRSLLIPLILPTLRSGQRLKDLQPELEKLKEKYQDKKKLQQEQLKLYRQHNLNPAAGCLPFLLQFAVLIALYRVFANFIQTGMIDNTQVNMEFLWLNLAQPDHYYVLPVLAGLSQFLLVKIMPLPSPSPTKKKSANQEDMATAMQKQMNLMMPLMTILISLKLPSGLALYWVATTLFSIIQQKFFSQWSRQT